MVLAARWAKARQARAEASRGHRRSPAARGGGRRGGRGQAAGAPARRCAPHVALARQEAENRPAGSRAQRALSAAWRRRRRARATAISSPRIRSTIRRKRCCSVSRAAAASADLPAWRMPRRCRLFDARGGDDFSRPSAAAHSPRRGSSRRLRPAGIAYSEDPSNRDPRFTRARLRTLDAGAGARGTRCARLCAAGGADAARRIGHRIRRRRRARGAGAAVRGRQRGPVVFDAAQFAGLPAEVGLRLLGRAIAHTGDEGPVELAKLEALYDGLRLAHSAAAPDARRRADYAWR